MTENEHYKRAMALLQEVETAEARAGEKRMDVELVMANNANMMRVLKRAEIHMLGALVRKT